MMNKFMLAVLTAASLSLAQVHAYEEVPFFVLTVNDLAAEETTCLTTGCCAGLMIFITPLSPLNFRTRAQAALNEAARLGLRCEANKGKPNGG